jgi:hypothetical protein
MAREIVWTADERRTGIAADEWSSLFAMGARFTVRGKRASTEVDAVRHRQRPRKP